jgi:TonB family protein
VRFSHPAVKIVLASSCWLTVTCSLGQQSQDLPRNELIVPSVNGVFIDPVPGAPFSATVEAVSEQKLSDGSVNVLHTINHIARDSHGRIRNERRRFVASSFKDEPPVQIVRIYDPTTGHDTRLDPYTLIARQLVLTSRPPPAAGTVPLAAIPKSDTTVNTEDLGTRTYEDLVLKGVRESRPAGITDQFWYSEDLSIYVIRVHQDPKWKQTITVTHIDRSEPDPSLFVVPADYKVVDGSPVPQVASAGESGVYRIGGGVSAPQVTYQIDPEYTDEARRAKFSGICIVGLIVDTSGVPRNVHVVRPIGKGLDEKAVEAVRQYTFKPAMYQGHPVPVELNIEVSFRIR